MRVERRLLVHFDLDIIDENAFVIVSIAALPRIKLMCGVKQDRGLMSANGGDEKLFVTSIPRLNKREALGLRDRTNGKIPR
ncbi:MAG: hypothetical protein V4808_12430 [Pseudomonadota bacterium]